ncbi:hypothetical protein TD95_004918 [Thielaviopsis punctulata]|uniref:Uncharacterized protein n=1 Tax=Thielaviopsis punctulata TaxID=72032 RepID=A0A0F4ZEK3_9PEZI|nr:hypothetical protein TD95_004918 [Thielaviopsis punctulata]
MSYTFYPSLVPSAASVQHQHSHHGRNRRTQRLAQSTVAKGQMRNARAAKDFDNMTLMNFRSRFEATRSFDLEDDMEFCPNLLNENDLISIHSASERSSLASNSPQSSPTAQPQTVATPLSLNPTPVYMAPAFTSAQAAGLKLHQPAATRARNPIPIINPATGVAMHASVSPPPSVSPGRMHTSVARRW